MVKQSRVGFFMTVEQFKAVTKALAILKPYAENPACREDRGHFILMWDGAWKYEGPDVLLAVRPIREVKPERLFGNLEEVLIELAEKVRLDFEGFVRCVVDHFKATESYPSCARL
jgi:hypothetical protein